MANQRRAWGRVWGAKHAQGGREAWLGRSFNSGPSKPRLTACVLAAARRKRARACLRAVRLCVCVCVRALPPQTSLTWDSLMPDETGAPPTPRSPSPSPSPNPPPPPPPPPRTSCVCEGLLAERLPAASTFDKLFALVACTRPCWPRRIQIQIQFIIQCRQLSSPAAADGPRPDGLQFAVRRHLKLPPARLAAGAAARSSRGRCFDRLQAALVDKKHSMRGGFVPTRRGARAHARCLFPEHTSCCGR